MKTVFPRPNGMGDSITVKIVTPTFGNGPTGAKSAAYRAMEPMVEATNWTGWWRFKKPADGLVYLPNTAITPSFFSESRAFLSRAGVSHERPEESLKAIERTPFTPYEFDVIRDAYAPFAGLYVFLRSDESTASGVGLWHSDAMPALLTPEGMMRAAKIVKEILKSDFSRDVIAFKRRVGLPMGETPGVFLMPAVGACIGELETSEWLPHAPVFHLNAILNFSQKGHLAVIGVGIGGGNDRHARVKFIHPSDAVNAPFAYPFLGNFSTSAGLAKAVSEEGIRRLFHSESAMLKDFVGNSDREGRESNIMLSRALLEILGRLTSGKQSSLYLELATDDVYNFIFLQGAPVELKNVDKPDVPEAQKIFFADGDHTGDHGSCVVGRDSINAGYALRLKSFESRKIIGRNEIPANLENYVLFVEGTPDNFFKHYSFAEYSKAAAIVFSTFSTGVSLLTHLNGALREAGILAMRGKFRESFINGLPEGVPVYQKLIVYANDAAEGGFVATI